MAKGPEIPKTDSAEIEILIERLKQNKWGVSGHACTANPQGILGHAPRSN